MLRSAPFPDMLHSDWILSIEGYMLHRRSFITAGLLSSIAVSNAFGGKGSALQAHVTYTGSGTVDDAHKLYVAVWDTPDFVKEGGNGTTPIALAMPPNGMDFLLN